jgi:hypothetical protein
MTKIAEPEGRSCCVADQNCQAPANLIGRNARASCFGCGEPVCLECSLISPWYGLGRKRICHNCLRQTGKPNDEERVIEHIWRGAGYPAGAGRNHFRSELLGDTALPGSKIPPLHNTSGAKTKKSAISRPRA